jgi:hypothetical protein
MCVYKYLSRSIRNKNIAQCQKAGFCVFTKFLTASKNGVAAGQRAFGFYEG